MDIYSTRMTSIILVFGFFFSVTGCSTKIQTLGEAEESYNSGDYYEALAITNDILRDNPQNEELLIFKARTLKNIAESIEQPENRFNYYYEMRSTLDQAANLASVSLQSERYDIIESAWLEEHSTAERLMEQMNPDSFSDNIQPVIDHLENAILIDPGNSSSYALKATAYYRNGEVQLAVQALQTANNRFDQLPLDVMENLAFLLLEEGQLQKSIELYETLRDQNPDNDEINHGLVNAYILDGQHESSISLLRELLQDNSENLTYNEALATELFFYIQNSVSEMANSDFSDADVEERHEILMADLDEAESHYRYVQENHPNSAEITFITAAFYKNTANHLLQLAESRGEALSERLTNKANELLSRSIPIWKRVAERNPENPEIWKSIYQIYTHLNMEEEAEDARSKANM
jgi:hypothetical protein